MKKIKQILSLMLVLYFTVLFTNTSLAAKGSFSISTTAATIVEGKTSTFTIKASNCEGQFTIASSDSNVVTVSSSNEWIDSNGKTITLTAKKAGNATITITATNVGDTDENDVTGSKTITVTVKAKTTEEPKKPEKPEKPTQTPSFISTNQTIYTKNDTTNLRANWASTEGAIQVGKGTELKLTGTSKETIGGYTWYRVNYNGQTRYVASSLITYTKPKEDKKDDEKNEKDNEENNDNKNKSSNKNLSSLSIEGIDLEPKFNKETTQYTAKVDGDVTELKIKAKAEDSKAKVVVEGNKDLKEGDNVIKVKVTAEDETTRTYFITVTQGEGTDTDTELKLSELKIERVDFEGTFKPDTYRYEFTLNEYVKSLEVTATPNQADAKVEVTGNTELKEGKNIVTILLTSADGEQTATYQIEVNVPAGVVGKVEEEDSDMMKYILVGVAVALAIIALILIIMRHRNGRADEEEFDIEDEQNERTPTIGGRRFETEDDEDMKISERTSRRINSDVTVDDLFSSSDEEQDREPRRPRGGRHSV